MRDYWLTQDLLKATSFGFVALIALCVGLALWLSNARSKMLAFAVAAILIVLPLSQVVRGAIAANEYEVRKALAQELFDKRCKTAGEKIYKTVDDVEGVLLVSPRASQVNADWADQAWPGAGFPGESGGNQYIMEFLYFNRPPVGNRGRELGWVPEGIRGYSYLETEEPGRRFRYRLRDESRYLHGSDPVKAYGERESAVGASPRYSISYENIDDPQGRASWIAGGRVSVVDRSNGELLGEFIRYSFEPGFGNTDGQRSPWAFAQQCPQSSYTGRSGHIRSFVEQVVKPKQGK